MHKYGYQKLCQKKISPTQNNDYPAQQRHKILQCVCVLLYWRLFHNFKKEHQYVIFHKPNTSTCVHKDTCTLYHYVQPDNQGHKSRGWDNALQIEVKDKFYIFISYLTTE